MTFKVITDHASLKWLMGQRDLCGRLARWILKLQGFNFSIEHRKGSANVVPDALSRAHNDEIIAEESVFNIDLDSERFKDAEYEELRSTVIANQERLPDVRVVDGHVFKRTEYQPRHAGSCGFRKR